MRIRGLLIVSIMTIGLASVAYSAAPADAMKSAADADKKNDIPMDPLTFFSKIIPALAWPLVTLILVRRFAPDIRELLKRIQSIKGFGIEAQLALAKLEANANSLPPAPSAGQGLVGKGLMAHPVDATFSSLMQVDPVAAISWKWVQLEDALISLNRIAPSANASRPTFSQFLNSVPEQYRRLFTRLHDIREAVVHKIETVNSQQAIEFADLSDRLLSALQTAGS